jgi:hypothetical protein
MISRAVSIKQFLAKTRLFGDRRAMSRRDAVDGGSELKAHAVPNTRFRANYACPATGRRSQQAV